MSLSASFIWVAAYAALIAVTVWVDLPRRWMARRSRSMPVADWAGEADRFGAEPADKVAARMARVGEVLPANGGGWTMWNGFDWVPVPRVNHDDKMTKG